MVRTGQTVHSASLPRPVCAPLPVPQLQHRFKKMQENIQTLVDGPLRTAEATFELERGELRGRILLLEQVRVLPRAWVLLATSHPCP